MNQKPSSEFYASKFVSINSLCAALQARKERRSEAVAVKSVLSLGATEGEAIRAVMYAYAIPA